MMLPERIAVLRAVAEVAHRTRAQTSPLFLLEALDKVERLRRIVAAQDRIKEERVVLTALGKRAVRSVG